MHSLEEQSVGEAPPTKRYWTFWPTQGWTVLVLGAYLMASMLALFILVGYRFIRFGNGFSPELFLIDGWLAGLSTYLVLPVTALCLWLIIYLRRGAPWPEYLGFRAFQKRQLALWAGLALVVQFGFGYLLEWLDVPEAEFMEMVFADQSAWWFLIPAVVIAGPAFEELLFRGFMYASIHTIKSNVAAILGAMLWPCLIWTLLHVGQYDWPHLLYVFLLSLVLVAARHYSGSLYVPLTIHMFFNLIAALVWVLDEMYGLDTI